MIGALIPSTKYDSGLIVATFLNQSVSIRFLGNDMEERNKKTAASGAMPTTAAGDPVNRPIRNPSAPKPRTAVRKRATTITTPSGPPFMCAPDAYPTPMYAAARRKPRMTAPVSCAATSALARRGVMARRLMKPCSMSTAMPWPVLEMAIIDPWANGIVHAHDVIE